MKNLDYANLIPRLHAIATHSDTATPAPKASPKNQPRPAKQRSSAAAKEQSLLEVNTLLDKLETAGGNETQDARKSLLMDLHASLGKTPLTHGTRPATITEKYDVLGRVRAMADDIDRSKNAGSQTSAPSLYAALYQPHGGFTKAGKSLHAFGGHVDAFLRRKKTAQTQVYKNLLKQSAPTTTDAISRTNLQALDGELGSILPEENKLFERLTHGELYFKHATDKFDLVNLSGQIVSPNRGSVNNGTTVQNRKFDHEAYVFGRLELRPGPMASRFGGATIEVPFDLLPRHTNMILRDQGQPVPDKARSLREDLSKDDTTGASVVRELRPKEEHSWESTYPQSPSSEAVPGNILGDLFVGRDNCREAMAKHLLVELRRMAGVEKDGHMQAPEGAGARFRDRVLQDDDFLAQAFSKLVHPQILIPGELDLTINGRALKSNVYNASGSGISQKGQADEAMRELNAAWGSQKSNIDGNSPKVMPTLVNRFDALAPHLSRLRDALQEAAPGQKKKKTPVTKNHAEKIDPSDVLSSFEILCTWKNRFDELLGKKNLSTPDQRTVAATAAVGKKRQEIADSIKKFAESKQAKGLGIVSHGESYVVAQRLFTLSER